MLRDGDGRSVGTARTYMIFHVGVDNNMYYRVYYPATGQWGDVWRYIPLQRTNLYMAVSATQVGAGTTNIFVVYRSASDNHV